MAKEKFERLLYLGPVCSLSILDGTGDTPEKARMLVTGVTYDDLPPKHPVVQNLKADRLLVPPPTDAEASADPVMAESETDKTGDDRSATSSDRKPTRNTKPEGKSK